MDCNSIVVDIYNHPELLSLINKIKPESLRDDLRQEIAVSLLEQPCEKIAELFAGDNLLRYTMKICWIMATSKTSNFYYKFKKSDILKSVEYLRLHQHQPCFSESLALKAKEHLNRTPENIYDDHEIRIFNKYIELKGIRKVARYYGIPAMHVCRVVTKVKNELKTICLS